MTQIGMFDEEDVEVEVSVKGTDNLKDQLEAIHQQAMACRRCDLWQGNTQTVFGTGNFEARLILVGEGPGENEDLQGKPFVGRAGMWLDRMLGEVGIKREDIWISNIVKHRATTLEANGRKLNREPFMAEVKACEPWLRAELRLIQPKVILCIGGPSAKLLIDKKFRISVQRGQWFRREGLPLLIATIHPAYLLRLYNNDRPAYEASKEQFRQDLAEAWRVANDTEDKED